MTPRAKTKTLALTALILILMSFSPQADSQTQIGPTPRVDTCSGGDTYAYSQAEDQAECVCPITGQAHDNDCKGQTKKDNCEKNYCTKAQTALDPAERKYRCEWHTPCKPCSELKTYKEKSKQGWFITKDCPAKAKVCSTEACNIARDTDGDGVSDENDSIDCEEQE